MDERRKAEQEIQFLKGDLYKIACDIAESKRASIGGGQIDHVRIEQLTKQLNEGLRKLDDLIYHCDSVLYGRRHRSASE